MIDRIRMGHRHRKPCAVDLDEGRTGNRLGEQLSTLTGDTAVAGVHDEGGTADLGEPLQDRIPAQ